jgi:secreted trypsin-like serine protease
MLLLSLLLTLPASAAFNPAVDAIYAGKPAAAGGSTWKYTAELSIKRGAQWYGCTGVFVESDLMITAAHCVQGASQIYIKLYRQNDPEHIVWRTPDSDHVRMVPHPRYIKNYGVAGSDDIAIIVLKDQNIPEDFGVADLQTSAQDSASDVGKPVIVVGAGGTSNGELSGKIMFANGTIGNYLTGGIMQVNFGGFFQNVKQQGVCGGDSGGPVFVSVGKNLYLTAINTSIQADLGNDCGSTLYTTSIDAARYNWIQSAATRAREELSKSAE